MKEPFLKLKGNMDIDVTLQGDEVPHPPRLLGYVAEAISSLNP